MVKKKTTVTYCHLLGLTVTYWDTLSHTGIIHAQVGGRQGGAKFLAVRGGENFFANLGGGDGFFDPKGGVKRTLLRGELKIVQQRGAKLPPGRTLNRGVQMKKNFVRGGQKKFSYGVLSSCACMILEQCL